LSAAVLCAHADSGLNKNKATACIGKSVSSKGHLTLLGRQISCEEQVPPGTMPNKLRPIPTCPNTLSRLQGPCFPLLPVRSKICEPAESTVARSHIILMQQVETGRKCEANCCSRLQMLEAKRVRLDQNGKRKRRQPPLLSFTKPSCRLLPTTYRMPDSLFPRV
jgi:hypothetical protein